MRLTAWPLLISLLCAPLFAAEPQSKPAPLKLSIAVNDVFCKQTACACAHAVANREYADFIAALRERYGIELELTYFIEPYQLVAAMLEDRFDGAIAKPWILLRHHDKRGAHLQRVADLRDTSGNPWLWGQAIVLKDSPLRTLEDAQGKRLVMGEDDGYEKHQGVKLLIGQRKLNWPAETILTRASCLEGLDLLLKREVEVAVISNYALAADCGVDVASPDQFRVIAETERIPLTSLMLDTRKVDPAARERLKNAVIELSRTALPASMRGGFIEAAPWTPQFEKSPH